MRTSYQGVRVPAPFSDDFFLSSAGQGYMLQDARYGQRVTGRSPLTSRQAYQIGTKIGRQIYPPILAAKALKIDLRKLLSYKVFRVGDRRSQKQMRVMILLSNNLTIRQCVIIKPSVSSNLDTHTSVHSKETAQPPCNLS